MKRESDREGHRAGGGGLDRSMCGPVCESMGKMRGDSGSLERRVPDG